MLNLKIDDFKFGIYLCEPQWIVNEKGSVYHRMYYVYDGSAVFEDSKEHFALQKDHLYLFPVHKPYLITHDPSNPFMCLFFHVTTYPLVLNSTIKINTGSFPAIQHMVKLLECIVADKDKYDIEYINKLLENLTYLIGKETPIELLSDERVNKALDFIHKNYTRIISNTEISNYIGFDHFYFIRLFRKLIGETPQKYITKFRLNEALHLIQGNVPVKEVAERVGFDDSKAFSRVFRKYYGFSPAEYKKSHFLYP